MEFGSDGVLCMWEGYILTACGTQCVTNVSILLKKPEFFLLSELTFYH